MNDQLPPLPWKVLDPLEYDPPVIDDANGNSIVIVAEVVSWAVLEHAIRSVNALADPDILALAEHLNAMDPLQRGAAMDEIRHAIGDWG